jgi:hypothetical protein
MGETCNTHGEMRNAHKICIEKPEETTRETWMKKESDIKWFLKTWGMRMWDEFKYFKIGSSGWRLRTRFYKKKKAGNFLTS